LEPWVPDLARGVTSSQELLVRGHLLVGGVSGPGLQPPGGVLEAVVDELVDPFLRYEFRHVSCLPGREADQQLTGNDDKRFAVPDVLELRNVVRIGYHVALYQPFPRVQILVQRRAITDPGRAAEHP